MVRLNKHQAATFIQKQWRGHLGRQRFFAELLAQERNRVKSTKKVKERKLDEIKLHQPKKQQSPSPKRQSHALRSNSQDSLEDAHDDDDEEEEDIIVYRASKKAPLIKASDIQSSVSHSLDSLRRSNAAMSLNSPQRLPRHQNHLSQQPLSQQHQHQVDVSSDSLNPDQYPLEMIEEEDDMIRDSLTNTMNKIPTIKLQKQSSSLTSSSATPSPHHYHTVLSHKSPKHVIAALTQSPTRKMEVNDKPNHNHSQNHSQPNYHHQNHENESESDWKNPVDEFEEEEEKRKKYPTKPSQRLSSEEDGIDGLSPRHLLELKEFMYDVDDDGDENEDSLELPIQTIIKKNLPIVKAQPLSHPTTSNNPTVIKSNPNTSHLTTSSPAASQRHKSNPQPSHPITTQPQAKVGPAAPNSNIPRFPSNKRPVNTNPPEREGVAQQSQQKAQVRSGSGLGRLGNETSDNDQDNALETIIDKEKFERLKRLYEESSSINDIIGSNSPQKKTMQVQPQPQPPQTVRQFVSPRPEHVTPKPPDNQQQPLQQSSRKDNRNDDNQSKASYLSEQSIVTRGANNNNTPQNRQPQDYHHQRPFSGNHNNNNNNNHHIYHEQPPIPSNQQQRNANHNPHSFPDDISQISDDFSYQPHHQRRGSGVGGGGGGRGQGRKNSAEVKGKNHQMKDLPPRHQQFVNDDREQDDQFSQYSNQVPHQHHPHRQNQAPPVQAQYVSEGYSSQYNSYQQPIPSPHQARQPIQQQPLQQQQGNYQIQYQPPQHQQQYQHQHPPPNKGGGAPPSMRQQQQQPPPSNQPVPNHKPAPQPSNQPAPQKKKPTGQSNGLRGGGINPSASEELEAQLLREIAMLNQKQSHLINHLFVDSANNDMNGHPQAAPSPQRKGMAGVAAGVIPPDSNNNSNNNKPRKKEVDPKKQKEKLAFGPAAKDFRSKEKEVKEKEKEGSEVEKKRGRAVIEGIIEPVNPAQIVKEWQQAAYRDQYQQPPNHSNHPKYNIPQGMGYQSPEKLRGGVGGGGGSVGPAIQGSDIIPSAQNLNQPVSLQPSGYLQHFDVKHQYHQQKQRSHSANRQRRNINDPHDSRSEGGVSSHYSSQQGGKKENLSLPPLISDQRQVQQQIVNAQGGYQHPLQHQNRRVANSSRQSTRSAPLHY